MTALAFFFEMPQNRTISFTRFFSRFKIDHVILSRNVPLFLFSKTLKCPIFPSDSENGHFKDSELKVGHFEEKARD